MIKNLIKNNIIKLLSGWYFESINREYIKNTATENQNSIFFLFFYKLVFSLNAKTVY